MQSGFCYLSVVREEFRGDVVELVGERPLVWVFLNALEEYQLDLEKVMSHGWYEGYDVVEGCNTYHIALNGQGRRVGSVAEVMFGMMGDKAPLSKKMQIGLQPRMAEMSRDSLIGMDLPVKREEVSPMLTEMMRSDLTLCFCRIHNAPVTADPQFAREGCCKRPAGSAAVVAAAFEGKSRMCHAEPGTRRADARLLQAAASGIDPGILDGKKRPKWFEEVCTSSETTDRNAFGNGYCYLDAMEHDTWWRCARLLGPNPPMLAVANVLMWAGKVRAKPMFPKKVADGLYHLVVDKSKKGMCSNAGRLLCDQVLGIVAEDPRARIGVEPDEQEHVKSSLALFRAAMKGKAIDAKVLVMMLPYEPDVDDTVVNSCTRIVSGKNKMFGLGANYSLTVGSIGMCAAVFPPGVRVVHDEATYGASDVQVVVLVQTGANLHVIVPHDGEWSYDLLCGDLYSVRGAVAKYGYGSQSTVARFVSRSDVPVVLRTPVMRTAESVTRALHGLALHRVGSDTQLSLVEDSALAVFRKVPVTDPLDAWKAMETVRCEGQEQLGGQIDLKIPGAARYNALRTGRGSVVGVFDGCVQLRDDGKGVIFLHGDMSFRLVQDPMFETGPYDDDISNFDWSIRVTTVYDDYCMDDGGPSGSDFPHEF